MNLSDPRNLDADVALAQLDASLEQVRVVLNELVDDLDTLERWRDLPGPALVAATLRQELAKLGFEPPVPDPAAAAITPDLLVRPAWP